MESAHKKQYKFFFTTQFLLRILGFVFTLGAALRMITSTEITPFGIEAKYSFSKPLRLYVIVNIVGSVLSFVTIFLILIIRCNKSLNGKLYVLLFIHDLVMWGLLMGAAGAATSIGYVGKYGQTQSSWVAICDFVQHFCDKVQLSLILGYIGALCYVFLAAISANHPS